MVRTLYGSLHGRLGKMSLFKSGFTSHSDKDNKQEKQTKGRAETKQKYEKEKRKRRFLPKWKDAFKWQHVKRDQHLLVLVFSLLPSTNYLHVHC